MALGWLYLYAKYRRSRRRLDDIEARLDAEYEICSHCGHPRFRHADDRHETCPIYITHTKKER